MFRFIVSVVLFIYSAASWAQTDIPETKINHAWVQGVYWNNSQLPGWGFFVDVQERTFFGAVYGYSGNDSTFITMQGSMTQLDPLVFSGDVYFVTNGGANVSDVGNFTWRVRHEEGTRAAFLTISSNILNVTNLNLVRLSYVEIDNIDVITGADWNLVEHILITFGDNFQISDDRVFDDGKTYVTVTNNDDEDDVGVAAYYPGAEGELYAMLVPLDEDTNNFFVFYATDTNMFGRYWLLDDDETVSGNGYYFHGSIATLQDAADNAGVTNISDSPKSSEIMSSNDDYTSELKRQARKETIALKKMHYQNASQMSSPMFSENTVQSIYDDLSNSSGYKSKQSQVIRD